MLGDTLAEEHHCKMVTLVSISVSTGVNVNNVTSKQMAGTHHIKTTRAFRDN